MEISDEIIGLQMLADPKVRNQARKIQRKKRLSADYDVRRSNGISSRPAISFAVDALMHSTVDMELSDRDIKDYLVVVEVTKPNGIQFAGGGAPVSVTVEGLSAFKAYLHAYATLAEQKVGMEHPGAAYLRTWLHEDTLTSEALKLAVEHFALSGTFLPTYVCRDGSFASHGDQASPAGRVVDFSLFKAAHTPVSAYSPHDYGELTVHQLNTIRQAAAAQIGEIDTSYIEPF